MKQISILTLFEKLLRKAEETQTRLCKVEGKYCFFHRWFDEDLGLLQFDAFVKREDAEAMRTLFDDRGICGPSAHIEKVRHTFALIEFTDGSVKKVDPEKVRFLDREEAEQ